MSPRTRRKPVGEESSAGEESHEEPGKIRYLPLFSHFFFPLFLFLLQSITDGRNRSPMAKIDHRRSISVVPPGSGRSVYQYHVRLGVREDLRYSIAKDSMIIKNESLTNNGKGMAKRPDGNAEEHHATMKDINLDFQKKITLHKEVRSLIDANNEIATSDVEFPRLIAGKFLQDDGIFPLSRLI
ncbi:hypothetical protein BHE74_00052143 [Ensete ventricosum]|uniref:Uncharacterized protein n=1 Tax=Ensete ventricosum TaxID=4639 RepID=A0A445MM30_ENSVE|nr:hypothetical protein BHE74_00052143 [Ensete ventricosum]RZR75292.1 hypothetical protein BHM03_00054071 [Ensete ventricosum]